MKTAYRDSDLDYDDFGGPIRGGKGEGRSLLLLRPPFQGIPADLSLRGGGSIIVLLAEPGRPVGGSRRQGSPKT